MGLKVRGVGLKVRSRAVDVEVLEEGYVYSILSPSCARLHVRVGSQITRRSGEKRIPPPTVENYLF